MLTRSMMKLRIAVLLLAAPLFLAVPGGSRPAAHEKLAPSEMPEVFEIKAVMRDLWITHTFWVRNVAEARLANDAGKAGVSEQQVVENAKAIARAFEPYYGKEAGEKLFALLAGHWKAISHYLDATKAKDKARQDAAAQELSANANDIAIFLAGVNPQLPANAVRALFNTHGAHHLQEIRQLAAKQYAAEAVTWTAMKEHVYALGEALGGGIAAQFPDKFD